MLGRQIKERKLKNVNNIKDFLSLNPYKMEGGGGEGVT